MNFHHHTRRARGKYPAVVMMKEKMVMSKLDKRWTYGDYPNLPGGSWRASLGSDEGV